MLKTRNRQAVVIGGGPGGLAAAAELHRLGVEDVLILEREKALGGILRQCIHDGFGLTRFGETLSGPEYAQRFIDECSKLGIEVQTDTSVIELTKDRKITAASRRGIECCQADAIILAMGCRERTRGALSIPGSRPAGIYTAGVAQAYINLHNLMVGREAVILGSGDIGMIMARRLTLEGAHVGGVYEIQPYPSGLPRNIEQCLNDYGIPLYLSHTVTEIHGKDRLRGVTVSRVDAEKQAIPGTERTIPCDTLILSVGLIPENELSRMAGIALDGHTGGALVDENYQTSVPGIFSAGNVLHVHDLVDFVSLEAERLARGVTMYLSGGLPACPIPVEAEGAGYVLPQRISGVRDVELYFRVGKPIRNGRLEILQDGKCLLRRKLRRAIPAEMERVELPASLISPDSPVKVVIHDA
jgi:NADPH-dependent 2,4-dienoyl-CoA reductase/sulfur reductase-like enzyme